MNESKSMFVALPLDIKFYLSSFLDSSSLCTFSTLNKEFHAISEKVFTSYLKPELQNCLKEAEFQNHLKATSLFSFVNYRLDKYVPYDKIGLNYLKSIGINQSLIIDKIKNSELTIQNTHDLVLNIKSKLAERHLTIDQKMNLFSVHVRQYILSGDMTIEQALDLEEDKRDLLRRPVVQKWIKSGEHTIADILNSRSKKLVNLLLNNGQKYASPLKKLGLNILNLTDDQCLNLESDGVQEFIDYRHLDLLTALNLNEIQRHNFGYPAAIFLKVPQLLNLKYKVSSESEFFFLRKTWVCS